MHRVIPVTIATAMAADVMRQRCFSVRRGPEETDFRLDLKFGFLSHVLKELTVVVVVVLKIV